MDYFELIEKRHSVRAYKPDTVETEKLEKIIAAARLAPTAANRQAFKIFIVKTKGREDELKKIYDRTWFMEAPYMLCVCSNREKTWVRQDNKNYSDVDAAIVMDHIILAAAAQGLGTCWIGAFDPEAVKKVLELDDTLEPVVLTPIGYEREVTYSKIRKPVEELVEYR